MEKMGILKEKNKRTAKNGEFGVSMLVNLPEEVLIKILITLPVKSLLPLRCVNKYLNSFLKNPYFIDLHMKQQRDILLLSYMNRTFLSFYSYESLNKISPNLEIPHMNDFKIIHSWPCNGLLVCVSTRTSNIVLCNPSTRECKLLPSSPFHIRDWSDYSVSIGLGFDSIKNDYKVVCHRKDYMFEVYNLSSNSWRQIDYGITYTYGVGVPLNGVLHWLAQKDNVSIILSFNVTTEVFQDMDLPNTTDPHHPRIGKILTIINDSLALFAFTQLFSYLYAKSVDIWVMKEGSWAKQVRVHVITNAYGLIHPCLLWKNEALLVKIDHLLKVCTLDTQIITDTGIRDFSSYENLSVMVYKESLVSVK